MVVTINEKKPAHNNAYLMKEVKSFKWLGNNIDNQLKYSTQIDYTGLQEKFPRTNFDYLVSFSPAVYEYENHFFPLRPYFYKFYDEGLKNNKIGCL